MAKKKQRKKVYKKQEKKLETQFRWTECERKNVKAEHIIKKENKGYLRCRACGEQYETKLKRASTPIDIYYSWIDERDQKKEKENDIENNNNPDEEDNVEEGEENDNNYNDEEQQQESEEEQYKEKEDPGDDEEEESVY